MKKSFEFKKYIKYVILTFSVIVLLAFITAFSYILYFNIKLSKIFKSTEAEDLNIKYMYNFLILSNENKNNINSSNKKVKLHNDKFEYAVNNVKNFNYICLKSYKGEYNFDSKEKFPAYVLKVGKNVNEYLGETVRAFLPEYLKNNKYVDVYKKEDDKLDIYLKSLEIQDGYIDITLSENIEDLTFVITYIPLRNITLENENLVINKSQQLDLSYKFYPENATDVVISCMASSDIIEVDGNKITGKEAGEAILTLSNGIISTDVNLKINEIASDIILSTDSVILQVGQSITVEAYVTPENAINKEIEWSSNDEKIASVEDGKITLNSIGDAIITVKTKDEPVISKSIVVSSYKIYPPPAKYNMNGLTYIDGILIANKKYTVPENFAPGVNATALNAFNDMKKEAARYGFNLVILSSYRSYSLQAGLYQKYTNLYGEEYASTISAKPGTSEHQTGLAFDISSLEQSYGDTAEGKWLAKNCARYGFIIRYQKNKENITGYVYEPWHIRYLGTVKAQEVTQSGLCLEEFLGV